MVSVTLSICKRLISCETHDIDAEHIQYEDPDSSVDNAASWSSVNFLQSSCQVSW